MPKSEATGAYRPLREGLDKATAELVKQGIPDACEQLKRAVHEKQLPIFFPTISVMTFRNILDFPEPLRYASDHRWRGTQRLMDTPDRALP